MDTRLSRLFNEHPATVGESYLEHMTVALSFAFNLLRAAGACFVHAFAPWLFTKTGSTAISELNRRMVTHRVRNTAGSDQTADRPPIPSE